MTVRGSGAGSRSGMGSESGPPRRAGSETGSGPEPPPERSPAPIPVRVLIADDHPVVREGLHHLLRLEPGFEVVGEASSGEEAVRSASRLLPDVILMDLLMPEVDGIEATRRILAENDKVRILVLTGFGTDDKLFPALKAGAHGFLLKNADGGELVRAIRRVLQGGSPLSPSIARRLVKEFGHDEMPVEPLSARETDVLREIAHGLSNEEIADRLCISPATVRTHVSHVLAKLGLSRRTQAVLYALRHGISELGEDPPAT